AESGRAPPARTGSSVSDRHAGLPRSPDLGERGIEVGLDTAEQVLKVFPQPIRGGPAPEPVADVSLIDREARSEHQRVRDGGVVVGIGVLVDPERALNL